MLWLIQWKVKNHEGVWKGFCIVGAVTRDEAELLGKAKVLTEFSYEEPAELLWLSSSTFNPSDRGVLHTESLYMGEEKT